MLNASAPSRRVQKIRRFPLSLPRIMSVLYDNTVRPRVGSIRRVNGPLIDIAESPIQMATRLGELGGDAGGRAKAMAARLEGTAEGFWADFSRDTAGTKTKLSGAGRRTGARLMLHGYLSSLVLLHVRFGVEPPDKFQGEEYFLSLVSGDRTRSPSPPVDNKPAVETTATGDRP